MRKSSSHFFKNISITMFFVCTAFLLSLALQSLFSNQALIPAIFVLGAFLTSIITDGYIYGVISALSSVLAVNYAFTFPFFRLNFTMPENLISALILILIALITSGLTTKMRRWEAVKAESEKERMRANLLRAVSHDLRTPLTTIYGASSAMLENSENFSVEQKQKLLEGIKEDSQWLSRMVENLLSITRLNGGNVKIIKTPTVLEELIDSVLITFKKRYPSQEVTVDIPDEFLTIPMDAILIEQVLVNILENAVQHAYGMTKLKLRIFILAEKAIFEIADNGCGIAENRLQEIFTGYYNDKQILSDGQKSNAGIGLSVCATIIKAHGGDIRAENAKDGGSVFRFSLDMEESSYDKQ